MFFWSQEITVSVEDYKNNNSYTHVTSLSPYRRRHNNNNDLECSEVFQIEIEPRTFQLVPPSDSNWV